MQLYYREDGDVIDARLDVDAKLFDSQSLSEIETISTYYIDEIVENKPLIQNILRVRYENYFDPITEELTDLHMLYVSSGDLYYRDGDILITPAVDQDRSDMNAEYDTAVSNLTQLRDRDDAEFTNAIIITAVKYLAKVVLFMLKMMKKRW